MYVLKINNFEMFAWMYVKECFECLMYNHLCNCAGINCTTRWNGNVIHITVT